MDNGQRARRMAAQCGYMYIDPEVYAIQRKEQDDGKAPTTSEEDEAKT